MTKREFYNSGLWRKVRNQYKREHYYICERCHNRNMNKGAKLEVHHKEPIVESRLNEENYLYNVALNPNNLELLCTSCHNMERNSGFIAEGLMFDKQGNILKR